MPLYRDKDPIWPHILIFLAFLAVALTCTPADAIERVPHRLRGPIKDSAARWMPGVDWRLWAAQVYQESRFNCRAVSPAGAQGCTQIMPGTWGDISNRLGWQVADPFSAELNIEAGAYYMAQMRAVWTSKRPEKERHDLAMASYNAGAGNILKAQKLAGGALDWSTVALKLPDVTGQHSRETINYVHSIRNRWYPQYLVLEAP